MKLFLKRSNVSFLEIDSREDEERNFRAQDRVFVSRFVARGQNCGNVRIRRMTHFLKQSLVLLKHVCASTICATIKLEQPLQMENH